VTPARVATLGLALASIVARAQSPPPSQTFRSRTDLVMVDLVVIDKSERPVTGLTAKDFVVREDGRERPIVAFEAFPAGETPTSLAGGLSSPGGATVVLVDDYQLSPEQAARLRPALRALLERIGGGSGRLMLVAPASRLSTGDGISSAIDRIAGQRLADQSNFPVADAEALAIARGDVPALDRVAGRFRAMNPEVTAEQAATFARERANVLAHDARARRDDLYAAALSSLDWLADQPGRHSLIAISAGFASDPDDAKYADVVTRSLRVNAPIHFVDARGLQAGISRYQDASNGTGLTRNTDEGPFGSWDAAAGATALADETGGVSIAGMNDLEKAVGRLLDSMRMYYLVGYEPLARDRPAYHKIAVDVRRKGLRVRARRGYFSVPSPKPVVTTPPPVPVLVPAPTKSSGDASLAPVMSAVGAYVEAFQRQLSGIVMEETYAQDFSSASVSRLPGQYVLTAHRDLKSDLLLIRPGNGARDVEFRDVFEVDGRAVRDRQERLTRLFLDASQSATSQLRAIIAESARYNIGSIERTVNTPTLPLIFLLPGSQAKVTFKPSDNHTPSLDVAPPADAVVVAFTEPPRNTLIHTGRGKDLPARGRFWIDPGSGRVLMTELIADDPLVRAVVDVRYRFDPGLGQLAPGEMRERYEGLRNGALVEGRATYGRFRRFQVKVDADIKPVK